MLRWSLRCSLGPSKINFPIKGFTALPPDTLEWWQPGTVLPVSCRYLAKLGLEGNMPVNGYILPSTLQVFDISNNNVNKAGAKQSLSDKWNLPEGFQQLWMINTGLKGSLPGNWRLPDSLVTLSLSKNR